jgi:hypothetical protein
MDDPKLIEVLGLMANACIVITKEQTRPRLPRFASCGDTPVGLPAL